MLQYITRELTVDRSSCPSPLLVLRIAAAKSKMMSTLAAAVVAVVAASSSSSSSALMGLLTGSTRMMMMMMIMMVLIPPIIESLDNGLGRTPPMGWNSWNHFGCNIHEDLIRDIADTLVSTGLRDLGYQYLNLDDW